MKHFAVTFLVLLLVVSSARAEEGFWTYDNPPNKLLKEKYNITLSQEWLDHIRLSSIRFNNGGSASFVSPDGLVLTNYHVGQDMIFYISTVEANYVDNGFLAKNQSDELPVPGLEVNILQSITDVTAQVKKAGQAFNDPAKAKQAREAEIARIGKTETEKTGLRCDIEMLYNGGQYKIFRYKKYLDIRLVFALPMNSAFFGGDLDNFTYPRYSADFALFRVYENDRPLKSAHYLKWNTAGPKENELLFVSGHPGSTERQMTVAQMAFERDERNPGMVRYFDRMRQALNAYAATSPEASRQVANDLSSIENDWKRFFGFDIGLRDTAIFNMKVKQELAFRARVKANPKWQSQYSDIWDQIEATITSTKAFAKEARLARFLMRHFGRLSDAITIVQATAEIQKPNEDRLEPYRESNLESTLWELYADLPYYPELEIVMLSANLQEVIDALGIDHPLVTTIYAGAGHLPGNDATAIARQLMSGTKITDAAYRRQLVEGGVDAVEASTDPFIVLARKLDPILRDYDQRYRDEVTSVMERYSALLAEAPFLIDGQEAPPDANFTLRLSLGVAKGYEFNGTLAPYKTTLYGLFDRAASFENRYPFALPQEFAANKDALDLSTPYNFALTADTVGGNSGSPVVNIQGELVGLIFDGNIESIVADYIYTEEKGRSVAVHPAIIIELLRHVYKADRLVHELQGM